MNKSNIMIFILLTSPFFIQMSKAQESTKEIKSRMLDSVIGYFNSSSKYDYVVLLADMRYRIVRASIGSMASSINYSKSVYDDSLLVKRMMKSSNRNRKYVLYARTFAQEKFVSRNDFIVSKHFQDNIKFWRKNKIYIEMHQPISGWETIEIFEKSNILENASIFAYNEPFICLPVYEYHDASEGSSFRQFIFKFRLIYENGRVDFRIHQIIEI